MAAVEADVLRRRLDDEGSNAGVMVSSSSGAMRPMENAAAPSASSNPVAGFLQALGHALPVPAQGCTSFCDRHQGSLMANLSFSIISAIL